MLFDPSMGRFAPTPEDVAAVTGRASAAEFLMQLGAKGVVPREELNEPSKRPLEKERWAGCVDAVGGAML